MIWRDSREIFQTRHYKRAASAQAPELGSKKSLHTALFAPARQGIRSVFRTFQMHMTPKGAAAIGDLPVFTGKRVDFKRAN